MTLQFNCQHCNELIISKFLKVGEIAECKKCGEKTIIPKNGGATIPQNAEGASESIIKSEQTISVVKELSQKYKILKSFQGLCYVLIFTSIGIFVYYIFINTQYNIGSPILLFSIALLIVSIFSTYCITLIIDFLFDLDKKIGEK